MSISGISFWQADRNWFIQQRVLTLSTQVSAPVVPPVDQSSHAAREADQAATFGGGSELKSAAISALELSSGAGYTAGLTSGGATEGTGGVAASGVTTRDIATSDIATSGIATSGIATSGIATDGPRKNGHLLDRVVG